MATANASAFLRHLTRGMAAELLRDHSDPQLVERLLAGGDEAAFEAVVRRHGPMVYRVCWRVLQQEQDTEDALQATFLILAQRLHTVRRHASLASWLHGIAHRVALKARDRGTTRRLHEQKAATDRSPSDAPIGPEWLADLDAELQRLPERWRVPLILCYLEGRTQEEAARQLGCSLRTLRRRLEEGREALGRRLSGRGVGWPVAMSAVLLSDSLAPAALAPRLIGPTVDAGSGLLTGKAAVVSAEVAALTREVLEGPGRSTAGSTCSTARPVNPGAELYDHTQRVTAVAFSPDGRSLLSLSLDQTAKVWDVAGGKVRCTLKRDRICAADLSPDGKWLATGGFYDHGKDGWRCEVLLWDAGTGKLRRTLATDLPVPVVSLAFSPDGKTLAAAGGLGSDPRDGGRTSGELRLIPLGR